VVTRNLSEGGYRFGIHYIQQSVFFKIITGMLSSSVENCTFNFINSKVKRFHTGLGRPLGLQEVEAPRFLDRRHMKVVRLSALHTGLLYPPGKIPGTHFFLEAESTPGP
jgi:hypothetical protein